MRLKFARVLLFALMAAATPAGAGTPPAFTSTLEADHPLVGRIWVPATRSFIDPSELVRRIAGAELVILGETHDNPDHHALQAWVMRHLLAAGRKPFVAFEMIDASQGAALVDHLRQRPDDVTGIGPAIGWEHTGWPDWSAYAPIADAALSARLPIGPANLSKDDTRAIAQGTVPPELGRGLGLDEPLDDATREAMEADIKASHCNMLPDKALPAMVRVQRARDAIMAKAMADGLKRQGSAVLIAGAGHARADRGVPAHLHRVAAGHSVFALAMVEVSAERPDPDAYGELYDAPTALPFHAVWFTPDAQREDPCDAFRRHMEKKRQGK